MPNNMSFFTKSLFECIFVIFFISRFDHFLKRFEKFLNIVLILFFYIYLGGRRHVAAALRYFFVWVVAKQKVQYFEAPYGWWGWEVGARLTGKWLRKVENTETKTVRPGNLEKQKNNVERRPPSPLPPPNLRDTNPKRKKQHISSFLGGVGWGGVVVAFWGFRGPGIAFFL